MKKLIITIALLISVITTIKAQRAIENKIEIRVEVNKDEALLTWVNKREVNTSYYIVEFADEQGKYNILTTRKAFNNTLYHNTYEFSIGTIMPNEKGYYRIVAVLMGGVRVYSEALIYDPYVEKIDQKWIAIINK